jgi:predicted transcriptional regulator
LRLRTSAFDAVAREHFGANTTDTQVARALGVDKTVLSQYRRDRRQPPTSFITTVLTMFAIDDINQLFEYVADGSQPADGEQVTS